MRRIFYNMQYRGAYGAAYWLNAATKEVKSADIAALHRLDQPWQPRGFDDQTDHLVAMPPDHAMVFA